MIFSPSLGASLVMTIDNTSTVHAKGASPSWYEIQGGLVNNGMLDLHDPVPTPAADDHVTVSTYSGSGSLGFDVALGTQITDPASTNLDLLTVNGAASGTATIYVTNTETTVNKTEDGKGILLVKVTGSNTATFMLGAISGATAHLAKGSELGGVYALYPDSEFLVVDGSVPVIPTLPSGGGGKTDSTTGPSQVVLPPPEGNRVAQAVSTLVPLLGLEAMPRFHERQAYGWSAPGQQREPASWWSRATGSRFNYGQESGGQQVRVSGYRSTMQVGSDLSRCGCGETTYRTGVFAGTGYLKADSRSVDVVNSGSGEVFTLGVGGYASVERRGHWYVEGVVQASEYDIDAKFSDGTSSGAGTWGLGVSVEGGAYVKVSDGFRLEPQAELMWQRIAGYGLTVDREHTRAEVRSQKGVTGRLGVTGTVMPDGWCVSPLVELNAVHDFSETPEVGYASTGRSYGVRTDRTWLGGAIGIVSRNRHPKCLEYYAKAGVMAGVDGHAGRDYTVTVGIRKSW
jgi:outer membrane autotransporter protein